MNHDISCAFDYHEKTKHSESNIMNSNYFLNWSNRPNPFKVYVDLPSLPLPTDFPIPSLNAVTAISTMISKEDFFNNKSASKYQNNTNQTITLRDISSILFFSCGITRVMKFDYGTYYMRAASATGALYPIEIYLVCSDLEDKLEAGIYHFNPGEFSLTLIHKGDCRKFLASIAANNNDILTSPISLIFTSFAWRNAWKYQSRSYRHWFWDAGVIAANLLAITRSMHLNARLIMGFTDDEINRLLGLEKEKEASILISSIGSGSRNVINDICDREQSLQEKIYDTSTLKVYPLSYEEIEYPEIWKAYNSSKLLDKTQVDQWVKCKGKIPSIDLENNKANRINNLKHYSLHNDYQNHDVFDIGKVILRRGSSRRFSKSSIPFMALVNILINSTRGIPMDYKPDKDSLIDLYLVVNAVKGLESGGYFFDSNKNTLDLLKYTSAHDISGHLCLDQSLFSDASVVIFLMANLKGILDILGNRGYRTAQMEAGIIAGKIYLLSYSYGLGASGSTFYDNEVKDFFSPHSQQKETMIAIGVGTPSYMSKPGSVLPVRLSREQLINESNAFN